MTGAAVAGVLGHAAAVLEDAYTHRNVTHYGKKGV